MFTSVEVMEEQAAKKHHKDSYNDITLPKMSVIFKPLLRK